MKNLFTLLVFSFLVLSCNSSSEKSQAPLTVTRQMGEFENIEALWLIWPTTDHKKGEEVEKVTLSIIDELISDLKIVISCADEEVLAKAKATLAEKYPATENLIFRVVPSVEIWTRDMGPVFVETNTGQHAIADFNFNSWGYADTLDVDTKTEEMYDERVAKLLKLPLISSAMISEGGNRELNGKGTLVVTETVEKGRNPTMTKAEMEKEYQRLLGVKKVIWLKEGLIEDSHTFLGPLITADSSKAYTVVTTNGHTDEYARFINDSTILLASIDSAELSDPLAKENYRRLQENYNILSESTDQDGKPFKIVRLPLPQTILTTLSPGDYVYDYINSLDYLDGTQFPDGDTITVVAPASYLNFIITNKVIIGQQYWREGMPAIIKKQDHEAKQILKEAFPNKKVVMIDALPVNLGGGGLHCISMHQPQLQLN